MDTELVYFHILLIHQTEIEGCSLFIRMAKHVCITGRSASSMSYVPMCQCANVPMCQCANVPMCQCANVPMCQCASGDGGLRASHSSRAGLRAFFSSGSSFANSHSKRLNCNTTKAYILFDKGFIIDISESSVI